MTTRRIERNLHRTLERYMDRTGASWLDAYATVTGADHERLIQEQWQALLDSDRHAGETRAQAADRTHSEWVDQQYQAAEDACRGHLLNAAGQARGIDPRKLFYGPAARAYKYASEELVDYWRRNPRVTQVEWRAERTGSRTLAGQAATARQRSADFEQLAG